jgi:ribose/xylose/arabinose/galactoside ABC-type transport system permease subunit
VRERALGAALGNWGRELTILAAVSALSAYLGLTQPNFINPFTIGSILTDAAYVAVVGVGMTVVIVGGQIDISVGSMLGVCALISAMLARAGVPMPLVAFSSLALGVGMGALNGVLVAYFRIPAIIVTLATLTMFHGAILWWTEGYWVMPLPDAWKFLGTTPILGLPLPIWIGWVVVGLAAYLLANTTFGRRVYAVGSNPRAAVLAGIDVPKVTFLLFALNGLMVGLAAMIDVTRFSQVETEEGLGLEFLVITAVVVGGTNIFGGRGRVVGTYLGVLLIMVTSSALTFLGISATWDQAIRGAFILLAVTADIVRTGQWRRVVGWAR